MKIIPPIAVTDGGYTGPGGSIFDKNGVLQQVAANTLRLSYNPSDLTACPGVLWDATARTNSIRNNTMQGAAAGSPGTKPTYWGFLDGVDGTVLGLSAAIVGLEVESGVNCIDVRFQGTANSSGGLFIRFEFNETVAASLGQKWVNSFFYRMRPSTSLPVSVQSFITERSATSHVAQSNGDFVAVAGLPLARYSQALEITNSTTAYIHSGVTIGVVAGQAYDFTIRIGLPQLERGTAPTSPILTTNAAVTVPADVAATTGTLSYSSLTENDTDDGPAWAAATSYAKGNRVRRPNHKVYENVIPGIDSATPESYANFPAATKRWFELRPTNRYAPFDLTYDTQAAAPEVFTIAIRPGVAADTVAFYNLDVRAVRVQYATPAGLVDFDKVYRTATSSSTSWSEYLFGAKERRSEMTITDLPLYRQGVILLTFWKPGSMPKVGDIVFGRIEEIGEMEWAPVVRDVDYSDTVTNDYGVTRFAKGKNANVLDCDVFVLNERFDAVNRVLRANKGRPIGVLGDERFDTLQFLGFIIERSGTLASPGGSWFNLQIQGLVETDD